MWAQQITQQRKLLEILLLIYFDQESFFIIIIIIISSTLSLNFETISRFNIVMKSYCWSQKKKTSCFLNRIRFHRNLKTRTSMGGTKFFHYGTHVLFSSNLNLHWKLCVCVCVCVGFRCVGVRFVWCMCVSSWWASQKNKNPQSLSRLLLSHIPTISRSV